MDPVPDLRAFGTRLLHCAIAFVLGQATAWKVAYLLPHKFGQLHASLFAPLFLVTALGCGLGLVWYAMLEAIRRVRLARSQAIPAAIALSATRPESARSLPQLR